jgi:anthranilate synthase component 1
MLSELPSTAITSLESFLNASKASPLAQVRLELTADTETPVGIYAKLVGQDEGFLLESVEQGERWSRFSFVGRRPLGTLSSTDGVLEAAGAFPSEIASEGGIFDAVRRTLAYFRIEPDDRRLLLESGLVGYFGYDTVREIEAIPQKAPRSEAHPDAYFHLIGEIVIVDHWRQTMTLVKNVVIQSTDDSTDLTTRYHEAVEAVHQMAEELTSPIPLAHAEVQPRPSSVEVPTSEPQRRAYQDAVRAAKEFILSGDIFQVVLSQRFPFELRTHSFELYRVLRRLNPSPYMYYFNVGSFAVVGASPEALVKVEGRSVLTRPIAGTRPRGRNDQEDLAFAAELTEHPKEIAEHIMLVDLARNDVGKVASFGTVHVDELMTLERFSHVMHLTSQVSATLREEVTPVDALVATLPAGTLSGAPKVRAMEIIDELEPIRRGIYGGVVGYIDFAGALDVAITIRTAIVDQDGRGVVQAGAGIVYDSDPVAEDEECQNKAKSILGAVALCNTQVLLLGGSPAH